jgi:SpoVK/Ycf46/Vps4 family AAA+-type ATPase
MNKNGRIGPTLKRLTDLESWVWDVNAAATWKDLTCPQKTLVQIKEICSEFSPSKNLLCLFSGESGTGKTLAPQVIANVLHTKLYRIDLSILVNKYIGETEKNLNALFFDEADALFGKRTDVKDSHDRYSNLEIESLLNRMENYKGLVILTTYRKDTFHKTRLDRFRHIIDFPS